MTLSCLLVATVTSLGWRLAFAKKVQITVNNSLHSFVVALSLCFTILPYLTQEI